MAAGDFLTVDMGGVGMISGVSYDFGGATDFPVAYKLEVSTDGTAYAQAAVGAGVAGVQKIALATRQNARYVRITQTATTGTNWWSIYNIMLTP